MGLKTHGRRGYAARSRTTCDLAHFLAEEVDRRPDFERLARDVLSIANFRYRPAARALSDDELDRVNRKIINRLVGDGSFFLAPTILKGRTALRVSHRQLPHDARRPHPAAGRGRAPRGRAPRLSSHRAVGEGVSRRTRRMSRPTTLGSPLPPLPVMPSR